MLNQGFGGSRFSPAHGLDLRGDPAPDLRIAAGYSFEAFVDLMRTGKALGNRELPMMSPVARERFTYFTDQELRDLYTFLLVRAAKPDSILPNP